MYAERARRRESTAAAHPQVALSPTTGELFAADLNTGISRFTITGGVASPNGTISTGAIRGVAGAPDGKRLYYTSASNVIKQFDLTTNAFLPDVTINTATSLHYLRFRGTGELYAADFGGQVFSLTVDANDNLSPSSAIPSVGALSVAFSPDLTEMFIAGHGTGVISQYLLSGNTWVPSGVINTGTSLGDILVIPSGVPEPASLSALALGGAALLLRRKNTR